MFTSGGVFLPSLIFDSFSFIPLLRLDYSFYFVYFMTSLLLLLNSKTPTLLLSSSRSSRVSDICRGLSMPFPSARRGPTACVYYGDQKKEFCLLASTISSDCIGGVVCGMFFLMCPLPTSFNCSFDFFKSSIFLFVGSKFIIEFPIGSGSWRIGPYLSWNIYWPYS